jgi:hypothetical protein
MYSATYSRLRVYRPQVNTSEREYPGTRVEVNCGRPPGWVALGSRDRECSDGSVAKWVRRNSLTQRPLHQDVISFVARSLWMSVRPLAHSDDSRLSTEPSAVTGISHEILLSTRLGGHHSPSSAPSVRVPETCGITPPGLSAIAVISVMLSVPQVRVSSVYSVS